MWLSAPDPSVNQNAASKKCQKDTGGWLLADPAYLDWRDRPDSFLWLQGSAGCGKTILCSTVINDMTIYMASRTQGALVFYYFDFTNDVKTKTSSCLRSIIQQLIEQTADTTSLQALLKAYAMGTPPIQEFLDALKRILCRHDRVYIVVDALDECTDQEELFDLLKSIRDWKLECLSILVTSRDEPDIRDCVLPTPKQEIRLQNSAIDNDVRLFIVETLEKDKRLQCWSDIFSEIEEALTNGAHGMFRWVDCQLQTLRGCPSRAEARKALSNLPETLDKTYERMLRNVRPNLCDYAIRLLQWLCIAGGPVDLDDIMEAFATSIGEEPYFDPDARFVSSDKVLALCPGLIIRCNDNAFWRNHVQIAHYSVKEYLVSNRLPTAPNPLYKFRVELPLANLAMAKTCLVYAIFAPHEPYHLSLGFRRKSKASFMRSARRKWPRFFSNAKRDSQLVELAGSYLSRKKGHSLDGDINTAMYFAVRHRFRDTETWLMDYHRSSINPSLVLLTKCKIDEIRPLDMIEFWIKQGADVNGPDISALDVKTRTLYYRLLNSYPKFTPRGSTPLHMAAYRSSMALAQLLLLNGASREAEDYAGSTPLEVAFEEPSRLNLDLIKLLWFDGGQNRFDSSGGNLLHKVARIKSQQGDQMSSLENNAVLMEETVAWLINHGVDPLSKDAEGETPLHKAAGRHNPMTIKVLYAATGKSVEYEGCLLAFLENVRFEKPTLSTAQLLLEIDPDPFRRFPDFSGLLPFLLQNAVHHAKTVNDDYPSLDFGLTALFLKHKEEPDVPDFGSVSTTLFLKHDKDAAHTKLDLYMSFLELIATDYSIEVSTILRWLAMELVKRGDLDLLGIGVWSGTLILLSHFLIHDFVLLKRERLLHRFYLQIQKMLEKRQLFGIGIKELYRLLLCTVLDRGPLAKLIISQEPEYTALGLSDSIPNISRSKEPGWLERSFVGLIIHGEIHPDTRCGNEYAALLNAIMHPIEMVRLLMKRLILKRACDINYQTREGLTILAGGVGYLPSRAGQETLILRCCLKAGCDANIQDDAGRTPLMIAAYRGLYEFTGVLLRARCNANLQDREGGTPVADIVTNNTMYRGNMQKLWKERFAPVGGHTALMYAVIVGDHLIVKALLEYGCDTKLRNNQGRTALDLAMHFDESEIVRLLGGHEESEQSDQGQCAQSDWEEYEESDLEGYE